MCAKLSLFWIVLAISGSISAQSLEKKLEALGVEALEAETRKRGDARRGAVVFFQQALSCARCHVAGVADNRLGPDLTNLDESVSNAHLIESLLEPSKTIREGYETVVIETEDDVIRGFLVSEDAERVVLRDAEKNYKEVSFARKDLTNVDKIAVSGMPDGLANLLSSEQQFYDLVRYLMEIRDGGARRALELAPDPALTATRPLPAYESDLDHRGLLERLDGAAFERGKEIYSRLCINCHGTHDEPGSLPNSIRFASGEFKNGSDPHSMYQTLTRGFGLMAAQTWMVPSQKYDVIHYIREAYLAKHNRSQYVEVDDAYLGRLPKGKSRGPAPSKVQPWSQMDYGPNQAMSIEVGRGGKNIAYKGNVVRLDAGPGGVAKGRHWMVYEQDTMRVAAAWSGDRFIDWNSIHFNGRHNIHPRVVGEIAFANPTGPGWGRPDDGSFEDTRLVGRDGRRYGPLPHSWARYRGMYHHGADTLLRYSIGRASILEMPGVQTSGSAPVFLRSFEIGARDRDLTLQVAHRARASIAKIGSAVLFGPDLVARKSPTAGDEALRFDGSTRLDVENTRGLNVGDGDFSVTARIKTRADGTIVAQTGRSQKWSANGLAWFVRGGRLCVDIGWVGAFAGEVEVADGEWHAVGLSYNAKSGEIRFAVDGEAEARTGSLLRKAPLKKPVLRIGFTSRDFPRKSGFRGQIDDVRFFNAALPVRELARLTRGGRAPKPRAAAQWRPTDEVGDVVHDATGGDRDAKWRRGQAEASSSRHAPSMLAGLEGDVSGLDWVQQGSDLRLRIAAGEQPIRFTMWFAPVHDEKSARSIADSVVFDEPRLDLSQKTKGGPSRWPHVLETEALRGASQGPFAVDVLTRPTDNPWFCQMRLTGFDFADADTAIVSAWDGSIWKVTGLAKLDAAAGQKVEIAWRRIASGLFQPLGVKVHEGKVYVTCRDQLCILHDLNGDEEIDWFECFNTDHQVTEHFHEFAMGLQVDAEGNFYYAKSARHAKPALVPHHGTLLKVTKDGQKTEIVANGFRAANGVCLNPDGTFVVTDQEGHWNPKNRINYVEPGGFYGNMYGYHDVTDSSDSAMEQPLVWITNSFDRSPGELLWVDSPKWGPLNGRLLNLSYGYGMVYIVPHEVVEGQPQGGMCAFPIQRFPTGVMRGRFHRGDGQLYLAGMFAWAGSQTQPGGLYRLRYTGEPVHLPVDLRATKHGVTITFSDTLDSASAQTASNYTIKTWDLKRTKRYGSKHFNTKTLRVASAKLAEDRRSVRLSIPDIAKTWCMEIVYDVRSTAGKRIEGRIHNTIHVLK